jgi:NhaP-type Na+/H+ or K+/H+ antiporter
VSLDTILVAVGATLLIIGLLSRILTRLTMTPVLAALVAGLAVGPAGLGLLDPGTADERSILEELARMTLAVSLMGAGLHIDIGDLRRDRLPVSLLLTAGMLGMWLLTGLGAWLLLDVPFWVGMLLGAILTPTDPVVASTIVTGHIAQRHLPRPLRTTLQTEAGFNDGLAVPLVLLAGLMATQPASTAMIRWAPQALVEIGVAVVAGLALGRICGRLLELEYRAHELEQYSLLGVSLALAMLTLGLVGLMGGSGILATFVAALAFSNAVEDRVREQLADVQETVARFFILPVFLFLGAVLPLDGWQTLGAGGIAFILWVLLVRRLPVVPAILLPAGMNRRDTAFLAWFGPMGIAGLFYALDSERFGIAQYERVYAAATLAIAASVIVHSLTATPLTRRHAGQSAFATIRRPLDSSSEDSP